MRSKTLGVAVVVSLALAACGTASKPSGTADSAISGPAVAWAACLRSHGAPDFPDPVSGHKAQFPDSSAAILNSRSPAVLDAERACNKLKPVPSGGSAHPGASHSAAFLEFAECMRAHGVPNYPDPPAGTNRGLPSADLSNAGIDTNAPAYISAESACNGHGIPLG
jgi:hypothetical protein